MQIKEITQIILEASEGHILTNGETYGRTVCLGKNDSTFNWHEITEEEYQCIIKEQMNEL